MSGRGVAGAALAAVAVTLAGGCGGSEHGRGGPPARAAQATGWTVVHERARGLEVAFPSSWRRARRSLTPDLADPREILSVGTGRLAEHIEGCAQVPTGALAALRPGDVLVSVQERRRGGRGFPARPARFRLAGADASEAIACLSDPGRLQTWFIPFRDGGRGFYALVAIGLPAGDTRRRQAERVLDSLRFTPRRAHGAG